MQQRNYDSNTDTERSSSSSVTILFFSTITFNILYKRPQGVEHLNDYSRIIQHMAVFRNIIYIYIYVVPKLGSIFESTTNNADKTVSNCIYCSSSKHIYRLPSSTQKRYG